MMEKKMRTRLDIWLLLTIFCGVSIWAGIKACSPNESQINEDNPALVSSKAQGNNAESSKATGISQKKSDGADSSKLASAPEPPAAATSPPFTNRDQAPAKSTTNKHVTVSKAGQTSDTAAEVARIYPQEENAKPSPAEASKQKTEIAESAAARAAAARAAAARAA